MKRFLAILFIALGLLAFALPAHAESKTWYLYLSTAMETPTSGVSTGAGGGVTTMVVTGDGVSRSVGMTTISKLDRLSSDAWVVQIDEITVTDQYEASGNYSGATFSLRYKESLYTDDDHWNEATTTTVFDGTALSGATRVQQSIYPVAMGSMRWEWVTGGTTVFSGATVMVRAFDKKNQ